MNIGIAPFAAHKGKIYPLDRMEKVVQLLKEKQPNCHIYLFCGKGEELELMQKWAKKYDLIVATGEGIRADLEKMKKQSTFYVDLQLLVTQSWVVMSRLWLMVRMKIHLEFGVTL